jgi:hypothetical protein
VKPWTSAAALRPAPSGSPREAAQRRAGGAGEVKTALFNGYGSSATGVGLSRSPFLEKTTGDSLVQSVDGGAVSVHSAGRRRADFGSSLNGVGSSLSPFVTIPTQPLYLPVIRNS